MHSAPMFGGACALCGGAANWEGDSLERRTAPSREHLWRHSSEHTVRRPHIAAPLIS